MSLIVAWDVLKNDDKNGVVTGYRVCYKKVSSSGDICNSPFEETMGNVRLITLSNLEKYTDYVVAIKAGTKIGFGRLGANMTGRTNEDSKYCMLFSFLLDRCTIFWFYNSFIIIKINRSFRTI